MSDVNYRKLINPPLRIWTIATGTFTQLVRMKTFWFLLIFALIIAAVSNIDVKSQSAVLQLATVKKVSFGAMDVFAWLYAIVATALLIPRDIEDRTLYTILTKPVQRIEYLAGKLVGVLLVVGASILIMFAICMVLLVVKQTNLVASELAGMENDKTLTQADIQAQINLIMQQGARANLFVAAFAFWLKAAVVAAVAILISTFASSSLFTIITSIFFFLIGHFHSFVIEGWRGFNNGAFTEILFKVFKLFVPDFTLFKFSEVIVAQGISPAASQVNGMILLTIGYLFVYLLVSLIVFLHKEF